MSQRQWSEEEAKRHFWIISVVRLAGAVFITLGLLTVAEVIDWPRVAGYILIAIGFFDTMFLPTYLARKWKSPGSGQTE